MAVGLVIYSMARAFKAKNSRPKPENRKAKKYGLKAKAKDCFIVGLKNTKLTDIVLPTSGPTAGLLDSDVDDGLSDGAAEAGMGDTDITDDDSDDEEMEADTADNAQVWLTYLLVS